LPSTTLTALVREFGHAGRHQVHDAGDLVAVERAAGVHLHRTDAVGFCCSRKKPLACGMASITRAACTDASDWMVRVSSPSSAALELHPLLAVALAEAAAAVQQFVSR
jgi:hypothetical protein